MQLDYRRDIHTRTMIISPDKKTGEASYRARMAAENDMHGFVKCRLEYMNGSVRMYYDVSGLTPLSVAFNEEKADLNFYRNLISALLTAFWTVKEYLCDADDLLLTKDTVFIAAGTGEIRFICFPFETRNTYEDLKALSAFLLSKTAEDPDTIKTACRLYTACSEETVSAEGFMDVLRQIKERDIPEVCEAPAPVQESFYHCSDDCSDEDTEIGEEPGKGQGMLRRIFGGLFADIKGRKNRETKKRGRIFEEYRMPVKEQGEAFRVFPEKKGAESVPERARSAGECAEPGETVILSEYGRACMEKTPAWLVPADIFFGDTIELLKDSYVAGRGRAPDCIYIPGKQVSRRHAKLVRRGDTYELTDLGSKNGTFVNGTRLASGEPWMLSDGDILKFADMEYHFCLTDDRGGDYTIRHTIY